MQYGARLSLNEHTANAATDASLDFVEATLNREYSDEEARELTEIGKDLYRHGTELAVVAPSWWDMGQKDEEQFKKTVPDFRKRLTLTTRMAAKLVIIEVDNDEDSNFDVDQFRGLLREAHNHTSDTLQVAIRFPWEQRNSKIYKAMMDLQTRKFMLSIDPKDFAESDASYKPERIVDLMNRTIHLNYDGAWDEIESEGFDTMSKYFTREQLYVTGEATAIEGAREEREEIEAFVEEAAAV